MSDPSYVIGDTLIFEVAITDTSGDPVSLSGASATWGVGKVSRGAVGDAVFTKQSGGGVLLSSNIAEMTLLPGDITEPGIYVHQLRITLEDGSVFSPVLSQFLARKGPL